MTFNPTITGENITKRIAAPTSSDELALNNIQTNNVNQFAMVPAATPQIKALRDSFVLR